jgi:hypothetical protein
VVSRPYSLHTGGNAMFFPTVKPTSRKLAFATNFPFLTATEGLIFWSRACTAVPSYSTVCKLLHCYVNWPDQAKKPSVQVERRSL